MIQGTFYLSYSHLFPRCISLSHLPSAGRSAPASQSQTGPKQNNAVHGENADSILDFFFSRFCCYSIFMLLYCENAAHSPKNRTFVYCRARANVFRITLNSTQRLPFSELRWQKKAFNGLFPGWMLDLSARYPSAYLAAPPAGQEAEGRYRSAPKNC